MHRSYLITTIIVVFLVVSLTLSETQAQTNDKPVVLSIADIQNITPGEHSANDLARKEIRNIVVSELVQNYDVCVLSRSQSYCFVIEGKVMSFSSIDNPTNHALSLPAADMAIGANILDRSTGQKPEGQISYVDLTSKPYTIITNVIFTLEPGKDISSQVVKRIVDTLHLVPKGSTSKGIKTKNHLTTWTVLPFSGVDQKSGTRIQENIELALSKSGKVKNLVDRAALDKVLQELKISVMEGVNQNVSGKIGMMVGADRILMGWVNGSRIDIHLVDAKTAAVIDAKYKVCGKDENIIDISRDMAAAIASADRSMTAVENSSLDQRTAEEDYYLKLSMNLHNSFTGVDTLSRLTYILNNLEVAYLLGGPNSDNAQEIAEQLVDIIDHASPNHGENSLSPELGKKAVRILESLLENSTHSKWLKDPLPWKINAYMAHCDFNKALQHIDQYQKNNPGAFNDEKVRCLAKLGRAEEAQELNTKASSGSRLDRFLINIKIKQGAALYKVYKDHFNSPDYPFENTTHQDCVNYFDEFAALQLQYEKPEEALSQMRKWEANADPDNWIIRDALLPAGVLLQDARCLLLLQRKEEAVRKCRDLLILPGTLGKWQNEAQAMIKKIEEEIGPVKDLWRKGSEISQIPSNRYIYILPVGDINKTALSESAKGINEFYGSRLRILEPINMKTNEMASANGWQGQWFSAESMLSNVLRKASVPDDALFLAIISKEQIVTSTRMNKTDKSNKKYDYKNERKVNLGAYSPTKGNPIIVGYRDTWFGEQGIQITVNVIKFRVILGFLYEAMPDNNDFYYFPYSRNLCEIYTCICSARFLNATPRHQICPSCQEQYKKADFDKVHANLIDYLKKAGAKIVKPEDVKFTEIGEEIKKANSKNNKPVEVKK